MRYGESAFIVLYLLFAAVSGILMLVRADGKNGRRMGAAALILGAGTPSIWCRASWITSPPGT